MTRFEGEWHGEAREPRDISITNDLISMLDWAGTHYKLEADLAGSENEKDFATRRATGFINVADELRSFVGAKISVGEFELRNIQMAQEEQSRVLKEADLN